MDAEEKIKILEAGKLGRKALEVASSLIEPGALFLDVAEKTENFIRENGGKPSFPLNLSINNEAVYTDRCTLFRQRSDQSFLLWFQRYASPPLWAHTYNRELLEQQRM